MTANTNLPGEDIQKSSIGAKLTLPPDNVIYKNKWQFDLYPSLNEPIDSHSRPDTHIQYYKGWSAYLGYIPSTMVDMWTIFYNYYRYGLNKAPSFDKVLNALKLLQKHVVEFNILTRVTNVNSKKPLEIYNFFPTSAVH